MVDLAALEKNSSAVGIFSTGTFLLCKHEAVPTGRHATQYYWLTDINRHTLDTTHYKFIHFGTRESLYRHTSYLSISHVSCLSYTYV